MFEINKTKYKRNSGSKKSLERNQISSNSAPIISPSSSTKTSIQHRKSTKNTNESPSVKNKKIDSDKSSDTVDILDGPAEAVKKTNDYIRRKFDSMENMEIEAHSLISDPSNEGHLCVSENITNTPGLKQIVTDNNFTISHNWSRALKEILHISAYSSFKEVTESFRQAEQEKRISINHVNNFNLTKSATELKAKLGDLISLLSNSLSQNYLKLINEMLEFTIDSVISHEKDSQLSNDEFRIVFIKRISQGTLSAQLVKFSIFTRTTESKIMIFSKTVDYVDFSLFVCSFSFENEDE